MKSREKVMEDHLKTITEDSSFLPRFWEKVDKRDNEECWPWLGQKKKNGDDNAAPIMVSSRKAGKRKFIRARRIALWLETGEWPEQNVNAVCKCRNADCVNPRHLFWGSGGSGKGFFTDCEKEKIKTEIMMSHNMSIVARKYGLSPAFVSMVSRGVAWKEINIFDTEGNVI